MTIPTKPDFAKAYQSANEILVTSSVITKFPFSTKELVTELFANQAPLVCRSYQKAKKYGLEITDFGSQSALLTQYGSRYIIFYDDSKPKTHARFSILHELGHKVIGHDLSNKDKATYSKYEIETNYFAAQLLMPEQIIARVAKTPGGHLSTLFANNIWCIYGGSKQAHRNIGKNKRRMEIARRERV